jgi:hypothetical protein
MSISASISIGISISTVLTISISTSISQKTRARGREGKWGRIRGKYGKPSGKGTGGKEEREVQEYGRMLLCED